jgi:hypothetical protein
MWHNMFSAYYKTFPQESVPDSCVIVFHLNKFFFEFIKMKNYSQRQIINQAYQANMHRFFIPIILFSQQLGKYDSAGLTGFSTTQRKHLCCSLRKLTEKGIY